MYVSKRDLPRGVGPNSFGNLFNWNLVIFAVNFRLLRAIGKFQEILKLESHMTCGKWLKNQQTHAPITVLTNDVSSKFNTSQWLHQHHLLRISLIIFRQFDSISQLRTQSNYAHRLWVYLHLFVEKVLSIFKTVIWTQSQQVSILLLCRRILSS